jgi:hypothetical protein
MIRGPTLINTTNFLTGPTSSRRRDGELEGTCFAVALCEDIDSLLFLLYYFTQTERQVTPRIAYILSKLP